MIPILTFESHSFWWGVDPLLVRGILDRSSLESENLGFFGLKEIFSLEGFLPQYPKALILEDPRNPKGQKALLVEKVFGVEEFSRNQLRRVPLLIERARGNSLFLGAALKGDLLCLLLDLEVLIELAKCNR